METYAKILMIASPIFFLFVMAEKLYGWYFKKHEFKQMDMISSLSSGFTNALKDSLGLGISLITYIWLEQKVALVNIPFTWLNVVIAFIALDFAGYWGHRLNHYNNFFGTSISSIIALKSLIWPVPYARVSQISSIFLPYFYCQQLYWVSTSK